MAKISQTLSMSPNVGIPNTSPARGSTSSVDAQVFSTVVGAGLELWGNAQAKSEQRRQQQQVGAAQTSLLDLQDESINQQTQARDIRNQIATFYADDGELSGDELKMMAGLQDKLAKFDLLSPSQRQIRKNALFRQALNDPANAGLQSSIISLFGGAKTEPVEDFSQADATAMAMDNKYGTGNWTQQDLGRERGRAMYIAGQQQLAARNTAAAMENLDVTTAALQDDIFFEVKKLYATHGAIPQDEANRLLLKAGETEAQMRKSVIDTLAQNGKYMSQEDKNALEQAMIANSEVIKKFTSGEHNIVDRFGIVKQLEAHQNLVDKSIEFQEPYVLKAAQKAFNQGAGNSFGGFDAMMEMFSGEKGKSLLKVLGIDENMQKVAMAQAREGVSYILTADAVTKEQIDKFGNGRLMAAMGGNVGITMADNPEQMARAIELSAADGAKSFTEIVTDVKNKTAIKAQGSEGEVKKNLLRDFTVMQGKIGLSQEAINSLVVEDGEIAFSEETKDLLGNNPRVKRANSQQVAEYLRNINSIIQTYPDTVKAEELLSVFQKEIPEEEAPTEKGGVESRRKRIRGKQPTVPKAEPEVLQEAITDPEELARIEAAAEGLAPVDPKDLIDKPANTNTLESSGFTDALSRLEAGSMGYDSINAVPTGSYQGHTNARSYITPKLKELYGSSSLTERTVGELIAVGSEWAQAKGSGKRASGAMGFGQITPSTMKMLVDKGVVSTTDKFDKATQDKMVEWLLYNKQPAVRDYLSGKHNDIEKAVDALGAEWEAFSKPGNRDKGRQILKALRGTAQ